MALHTTPTREQILEAADARFRQFGFSKTTMAEIAADCDMSAANLYRYFPGKAEIGAAVAQHCLCDQVNDLRALVRADGLTAAEKIETFVTGSLGDVYEALEAEPRLSELIQFISRERADLVREHKFDAVGALVSEIISQGNASGEFDVADVVGAARTVVMATFAFHSPFLIMTGIFEREELASMARDTARLLVNGLKAR